MILALIRHAESLKNVQNRHGSSDEDWPLTSEGREAATALSEKPNLFQKANAIYSSDSAAPLETALIFAQRSGLSVVELSALRAVDFGVVSGLSGEEIERRYPLFYKQMQSYEVGSLHPKDFTITGREPFLTFEHRAVSFAEMLMANYSPTDLVLVFAHRSFITMTVNTLSHYPQSAAKFEYKRVQMSNLAVSAISCPGVNQPTESICIGTPIKLAVELLRTVI